MSTQKQYTDCLKEMYGLRRFGIVLDLSTIRTMLKSLGNPQNSFPSIHIAGTNGKGSIASSLSSILQASGYRVGLYTSPHLVRFNERICVNNRQISDKEVLESFLAVKKAGYGKREPTFFEYTTAMALYEFRKQNVDWAVIETGMGGRLDATNILKPEVSIISNLSIEHKMYLGNTIEDMAREKGGIIKSRVPVITGVKQKKALSVLDRIAKEKSAPLYRLGDHFKVRRNNKGGFNYYGLENTWRDMKTGLKGNYQIDNMSLVLAACEVLMRKKSRITPDSIQKGIETTRWPGRLEVVSTSPYILLDGAHNLAAAKNLATFLADNFSGRKLTLIIGILEDKPYKAMLSLLLPVCQKVILTRPGIDRAIEPEKLYKTASRLINDITIAGDVGKAIQLALEQASDNDVICIAGSLYVVGEAKEMLETGKISFSNMV